MIPPIQAWQSTPEGRYGSYRPPPARRGCTLRSPDADTAPPMTRWTSDQAQTRDATLAGVPGFPVSVISVTSVVDWGLVLLPRIARMTRMGRPAGTGRQAAKGEPAGSSEPASSGFPVAGEWWLGQELSLAGFALGGIRLFERAPSTRIIWLLGRAVVVCTA